MFLLTTRRHIQTVCAFSVLLSWASFTFAEEAKIPQQVMDSQKAAIEFSDANDIASAVVEYQKIISSYAGSDYAIDAQSKVVGLLLQTDQRAKADAAVVTLMSNPSGSPAFREAVYATGAAYRWTAQDPAKARQIYNQWLNTYSTDLESYKIQCAVVKTYFEESNIEGADAALEQFKKLCVGRADVHHEMGHLADVYHQKGYTEKALELHQWFVTEFPQHEKLSQSYATQIVYANSMEPEKADAKLEQLMSNYANKTAFREAVLAAGTSYRWGEPKEPAKGRQLYNRWLDKYSADPESYKIQCGVVKTYLEENNIEGANAALERFKELCQGRADVYHEASHLAGVYREMGYPEKTLELHQWLVAEYSSETKEVAQVTRFKTLQGMANVAVETARAGDPNTAFKLLEETFNQNAEGADQLLISSMATARIYVHQGRDAESDAIVKEAMEQFKEAPAMSEQMFGIGEEYYVRAENALKMNEGINANADYLKAVEYWKNNINQSSDSQYQCYACYYSGITYQKLNQNENAIRCFQQLVSQWPDYEKSWYGQYIIAKYYEMQAELGTASRDVVRSAYQLILDKYPDSSAAQIATQKLNAL